MTSETEVQGIATTQLGHLARLLDHCLFYCILHGWQSPPKYPPSDLDIAVAPDDLARLEGTLMNTPSMRVTQLIQYEATGFYFVLETRQGGKSSFLSLDAAMDYRLDGRVFFRGADLLRNYRKMDGFTLAAPEVEFAYLLVKKISKGTLPEHQRMRVQSLYVLLGAGAQLIVRRMLGASWGNRVIDWLGRSDWAPFEAQLPRLKRALHFEIIKRDPLNAFRYWGPDIRRRWRRWRQPTGVFVAVLGPDGAGKSTLVEHLRENLAGAGFRRFCVFHHCPRRKQRTLPYKPTTHPHKDEPYPPWLSLLKVSYYVWLYLVGYWFIVRPRLVRSTLVLFDRYYDDLLVDPRRYRYGGAMIWPRLARYFVHQPDLYLVLDVPEAQLRERKQEVSREESARQGEAYRWLASERPSAVLLDGSAPPDEVARSATDVLVAYLQERYVRRRRKWFGSDNSENTLQWLTSVLCSSPDDARFVFPAESPNNGASAWSTVKKFGWLPLGDGRAYLIPLEPNRVGRKALELYNPQTLKARLARTTFDIGLRVGAERRLMPTVHLIARRKQTGQDGGNVHMLEHLRNLLQREDLSFGISVGTPGPRRKPVLLVLGASGETLAYVKVGSSDLSNALVHREVEALQFLANQSCHSFSTPIVLHSGWWNGRYLVVQSAPKLAMPAVVGSQRRRFLDIPQELASLHTRWTSLKESSFWEDILLRTNKISNKFFRNILERAVRKADDRLQAEQLPFHLSHGDFAPWNTRRDGEKIYVFDWEHSREAGLPAEDILHFRFQEMRHLKRRETKSLYVTFLDDRLLRMHVETHLGCLGLTGIPLEYLFLLYRLGQLAKEATEACVGAGLLREFTAFETFLNTV